MNTLQNWIYECPHYGNKQINNNWCVDNIDGNFAFSEYERQDNYYQKSQKCYTKAFSHENQKMNIYKMAYPDWHDHRQGKWYRGNGNIGFPACRVGSEYQYRSDECIHQNANSNNSLKDRSEDEQAQYRDEEEKKSILETGLS